VFLTNYYKCDQVKEDEISGTYSTHTERKNAYKILVDKPESRGPLERH